MAEPITRIPPSNLDAERAVLGAILLEGASALERVALQVADFQPESHRIIFRHIVALNEAGTSIDRLTVEDAVREAGEIGEIGGAHQLALLMEHACILANLADYVSIVLREAGRREMIQEFTRGIGKAYDNGASPAALATETGEALAKIAERTDAEAFQQSSQHVPQFRALHEVLETTRLNLRFDVPDLLPSPIVALNARFGGGFKRKELILIGGGPGVAKSTLMEWWARYAAQPEHGGHLVAIVSIEMAVEDLGLRILADAAQVSATALRGQNLDPDEEVRLDRIVPTFQGLPVLLSDQVTHIRQLSRFLRRRIEHGEIPVRLLVVDYLQLLEGPPGRARYEEVGFIAKMLKRIARRYDCTVLALSSITPDPPQKGKKAKRQRPTMRNLRESRDLDHAADVILMLWQPDPEKAERELIIDKGRNGHAEGFGIRLQFIPMYQRFIEEI